MSSLNQTGQMINPDYGIFTFPSEYIFCYSVPNHKEIKQDILPRILNEYQEKQQEESYRWNPGSKSNVTTNYYQMNETLLSPEQQVDVIWNPMDAMLSIFYAPDSPLRPCPDAPKESNINSLWWNVYNEGDYVELHNHSPAGVSGFYLIDLPEDQENGTVFSYRNPYALSHKMEMWAMRHQAKHLKEGDVVLFPSSLEHYVNPTKGRKVSISFNIEVTFE